MRRLMRDVGEWVEEGRMWEEGGRERRVSRVERDRRERIRIEWMEEERDSVSFPSRMKKKIGSDLSNERRNPFDFGRDDLARFESTSNSRSSTHSQRSAIGLDLEYNVETKRQYEPQVSLSTVNGKKKTLTNRFKPSRFLTNVNMILVQPRQSKLEPK